MGKRFRILSIDGGGIRGLIPAMVLADLERRTNRPVYKLFDAITATSTGAIIAAGLTRPDVMIGEAGRLCALYMEMGPKIFSEEWRDKLGVIPSLFAKWLGTPRGFDVNDLWRPRYTRDARRKILGGYFGDTAASEVRLTSALLPLLIPSYDTELRTPVLFVSRQEHQNTSHPYYEAISYPTMLEAVMCATAAPTYFPPERIARVRREGSGSDSELYSLIDGSIFAANPAALGRAFLRPASAPLESDIILSLGTGAMQQLYAYNNIKSWGLASWASPALKMTLDGQCESASLAIQFERSGTYLRVQGPLGDATDELDDVRESNLHAISEAGLALCRGFDRELDQMAKLLVDAE